VRAFSDDDLIQSNAGSAVLVSSQDLTVPAGTSEGTSGIIVAGVQLPIVTPDQWHVAASTSGGLLQMLCRADLPAGESSWTLTAVTTCNWAWTVAEWGNIAFAPIESTTANLGTGGASSVSTGSTGAFTTQFVMGIAGFVITSAGGAAWPSVSYDNSFTETDSQQSGTGTANGDILLKVARRYGTDSDAGPWSCTATFTGSMASKTPMGAMVVFRAEDTADPPLPVMTS
jgi:hypothetical protein